MGYYRKKPVVIEAVKLTWRNWNEVCELLGDAMPAAHGVWVDPETGRHYEGEKPPPELSADNVEIGLVIPTLEGDHLARQGDFVIKGVEGEFYPCKPDIFRKTYESADPPSNGVQPVRALSETP